MIGTKPIELLCFEEDHLLGDSMVALFGQEESIHLPGIVEHLEDLEHAIEETRPQVLLLDVDVIEHSDLLLKIASRFPNVCLLILADEGDCKRIDLAVDAGAMGYLMKLCTSRRSLIDAVQRIASGEFHLGECLLQQCHRQSMYSNS